MGFFCSLSVKKEVQLFKTLVIIKFVSIQKTAYKNFRSCWHGWWKYVKNLKCSESFQIDCSSIIRKKSLIRWNLPPCQIYGSLWGHLQEFHNTPSPCCSLIMFPYKESSQILSFTFKHFFKNTLVSEIQVLIFFLFVSSYNSLKLEFESLYKYLYISLSLFRT